MVGVLRINIHYLLHNFYYDACRLVLNKVSVTCCFWSTRQRRYNEWHHWVILVKYHRQSVAEKNNNLHQTETSRCWWWKKRVISSASGFFLRPRFWSDKSKTQYLLRLSNKIEGVVTKLRGKIIQCCVQQPRIFNQKPINHLFESCCLGPWISSPSGPDESFPHR